MERKIELGYWQIKLKGHHIRWLLHYLKKDLGDFEEWFPKTPEEWLEKKAELSHLNPLVTLPYIKSGETVVARPQAIMMAICMKANRNDLLGKSLDDAIEIRGLQNAIDDLRSFAWECTKMSKANLKRIYADEFSSRLTKTVSTLGVYLGNKKYLVDHLSVVDFELAHVIELYGWLSNTTGVANPFITHSNLMKIVKTIKKLPGVSDYMTSPEERSMKWMKPGTCRFEIE
jgi:hypothetical protein